MKSSRTNTAAQKHPEANSLVPVFNKPNFLWMLGGIAVMIIGFLLMSGGRSTDPNVFDPNQVYSTTRITVAPILILAGLVILIIAIFRQPKNR